RTWRHGSCDADYQWTAVNRLMKFEGPYAPRVKAGCWRMHARGTARRSLWSFAPVLATDQRSLMSAVPPIATKLARSSERRDGPQAALSNLRCRPSVLGRDRGNAAQRADPVLRSHKLRCRATRSSHQI